MITFAQILFSLLLLSLLLFVPAMAAARLPAVWRVPGWGQVAQLAACVLLWFLQWPVYFVYVLPCLSGHCRGESVLPGLALAACNLVPAAWLLWKGWTAGRPAAGGTH